MADANDVMFLILTSHGSPDGLAVVAGRRQETLTPPRLADMLNATGVRYRAVVISACYSGVFIPRLANADTLVITAADGDHASFGCEDRAKWTYFGDAFFNVALRRTTRLKDAFAQARAGGAAGSTQWLRAVASADGGRRERRAAARRPALTFRNRRALAAFRSSALYSPLATLTRLPSASKRKDRTFAA